MDPRIQKIKDIIERPATEFITGDSDHKIHWRNHGSGVFLHMPDMKRFHWIRKATP